MKMFLTRMGPIAKVVVTGDLSQVDLPARQKTGLEPAIAILKNNIPFVHGVSGKMNTR